MKTTNASRIRTYEPTIEDRIVLLDQLNPSRRLSDFQYLALSILPPLLNSAAAEQLSIS